MKKVCLVGRPNVGKSSLFNRLIGRRKALVLDQPGVTRDVVLAELELDAGTVQLADLAGLESDLSRRDRSPRAELARLAQEAALDYLKKSDLVLFVVDARSPLTPHDEHLSTLVRMSGKSVIMVLSKVEGKVEDLARMETAALGWEHVLCTSAEHNLGISDLKDAIAGALELSSDEPNETLEESVAKTPEARGLTKERPIRMAVYGRPNVGKSTLVNYLLGEKRMITSPIAGTTVDTVDSDFEKDGRYYRILDTAGIRRKSKTDAGVEVLSVVKAIRSVVDVDIALFLIDGYEGITDQDEKIAGELRDSGRPIVLIVNKWDLCGVTKEDYAKRLRDNLDFLDYAPILFICAEKGEGIEPLFDLIDEMVRARQFVAPTGELNRFIEMVEGCNVAGDAKLYYASQTQVSPPTITFLVNDPKNVRFSYERYLRNELRNRYNWMGSPIRLVFKARSRSPSKKSRGSSAQR